MLAEGEERRETGVDVTTGNRHALTLAHLMCECLWSYCVRSLVSIIMSMQTIKGKEKSSDVKIQKVCHAGGGGGGGGAMTPAVCSLPAG